MFYDYVQLEDDTHIAYSNVLADGSIEVSVERPIELGFDSARCVLPSLEWHDVTGFSPSDMLRLTSFIRTNAPLIMRLAREASREYA